ncbi:MAG: sensor histidine kinase [Marinoscillum sp.]|uniref:sensor histidine kinase n=1 Tax=Marinoscillum sp. TaxID=2024838 RepID=UPI0033029E06
MRFYLTCIYLLIASWSLTAQVLSDEVRSIYNFNSAGRFIEVWDSLEQSGNGVFQNPVGEWLAPVEYFYEKATLDQDTVTLQKLTYPLALVYHTLALYQKCIPLLAELVKRKESLTGHRYEYAILKLEEAYRRTGNLKEAIPLRKQRIDAGFEDSFWEIYAEADLFTEAIKDFRLSEDLPPQGWNRMVYFMDLASLFKENADYDSAIYYYEKAHEDGRHIMTHTEYDGKSPYTESNKHYWTAYSGGMIGQVLVAQGNYEEAIPLLMTDIAMSKTIHEVDNTLNKRLDLAECFIHLEDLPRAASYIDTVKNLLGNRGWLVTRRRLLEVEAEYFYETRQFGNAAKYLKEFNKLNDSLNEMSNRNNLIAMTTLLDSDQQRAVLAEQKLEIEKVNSIKKNQSNQVNLLISGMVILTLVIVVLFLNYKQKLNSKLEAERKLEEKDIFLRELHHRIKNNLQITSGLLQLQADKSNDDFVNSALKESKGRIKSMALIHNLLIGDNSVSSVSLKKYIEELVRLVEQSLGRAKDIRVVTYIEDLEVDDELAVPLGLIINEILTNSYKYAFDSSAGEISIRFCRNEQGGEILEIRDNGKGFPAHFSIEESDSLGMQLITMLCGQIRANLNIFSDGGAVYRIQFNTD